MWNQYSQWMGQCKACGEWNTIVEEVIDKGEEKKVWKELLQKSECSVVNIKEVSEVGESRIDTRNDELNRVLEEGLSMDRGFGRRRTWSW